MASSRLESKVDEILNTLAPMSKKLDSIEEQLKSVKFDVDKHGDRLDTLDAEVLSLKNTNNALLQQQRSLTLRLLNFPFSIIEKDDLKGRLYELLRPLLAAAKAEKDLSTMPQANSVIETCFMPYAAEQGKPPPPIIFRVPNRSIKVALLKNKKHLILPGEGLPKFLLVEDLTPETHRLFNLMVKSKRIGKVWTVDGVIKYTLPDQTRVKSVNSVFASIEDLVK